jgi:hypothetical protein
MMPSEVVRGRGRRWRVTRNESEDCDDSADHEDGGVLERVQSPSRSNCGVVQQVEGQMEHDHTGCSESLGHMRGRESHTDDAGHEINDFRADQEQNASRTGDEKLRDFATTADVEIEDTERRVSDASERPSQPVRVR